VLPRQNAPLVRGRVAAGREIIVRSALLVIRGSLVAPTRRLVVIRPRLILTTRHPLAITHRPLELTSQCITIVRATIPTLGSPITVFRRLVTITRGLIANLISPIGQRFAATRRTRQSRCHAAAGSTLHNVHHRLPLPQSERPGERLSVLFPHRSTLHRPLPPPA
jgi:hypothetical protein